MGIAWLAHDVAAERIGIDLLLMGLGKQHLEVRHTHLVEWRMWAMAASMCVLACSWP
jgi:hypothetical protein